MRYEIEGALWGARGILTWQNGLPQSPSTSLSRIGTCSTAGSARPDRVGNGNLPSDQRTINDFYDVTAFALLPAGGVVRRVGNSGRNVLIGLRLTTSISASSRTRAFVSGNHSSSVGRCSIARITRSGAPSVNLESPSTFGVITITAPPRIMQLVLRDAF